MPENSFIDTFVSIFRNRGVARANRFLALVNMNPWVAGKMGFPSEMIKRRLALTCVSAGIPQKGFVTHENAISAPPRLVPFAINSNNSSGVSLEFHVLSDMFEVEVFKMWQSLIIDPITKEQTYYDEYAKGSSIRIIQIPYDVYSMETALEGSSSNTVSGVELTEIYPTNFTINNGALEYGQTQETMKVKVDFGFREIYSVSQDYSPTKWIQDEMPTVDQNGNFLERLQQEGMAVLGQGKGFKIF